MKKLVCVIAVLCLIVTAAAALAEEAPALNWEDFAPVLEAGGVSGEFYTFDEIAVKIWVPEGMNPTELSDEDKEKGYIGYFMPEDESAAIAVRYVDTNGTSLEDYAAYLSSESDVTEVEMGNVNGLPCVTYRMPEQDSVNVTFATVAGYLLEVTCSPAASVENAEMVWGAVAASIQNAE